MTIVEYFKILCSLIILFGILFGFVKLSKVVKTKKFTGELKIIDRLPIDSHVSLMIVKVRSQEMLISVGGKDVKVLNYFDKKNT